MSYTCSITTNDSQSAGDLKRFLVGAIQSTALKYQDNAGNYAWETHSFEDFGITGLRSPAGTSVYRTKYLANDGDVYITASTGKDFKNDTYVGDVDGVIRNFLSSFSYPLTRTVGVAPHFQRDIKYVLANPNDGDLLEFANEPPNNHVELQGVTASLNNYTPFYGVTGSATAEVTAQGKTNTFYSYIEWCNKVAKETNPIQLGGTFSGTVRHNAPHPANSAFQTTHPFFYKYRFDIWDNPLSNQGLPQEIIYEQISASWKRGDIPANNIVTTAKFKTDTITSVTASSTASLGADLLDVYRYHSESLATFNDGFPGAGIYFGEWKAELNKGDDEERLNPGQIISSSRHTANMLLSMARLAYEFDYLKGMCYQTALSPIPTALVYFSSSQGTSEFQITANGEVYKTFKPAMWGTYFNTPMIGGSGVPLGGSNRPRNVMVEAFKPDGEDVVLVCWVNNTGSGESIDVNIDIDGVNTDTITMTPFSYGSQSYDI